MDDSKIRETVLAVVERLQHKEGALMPVLHAIQDELGYVPPSSVAMIAEAMNLSRADVHGVVSFYHYFRTTPPGRHTVRLCRAEACQSMQAGALERHAKAKLGVDYHGTTKDGAFSLEPVYCLGNCALSPAMTVDDRVYGRVTPQRFDAVVAEWETR